MNIVLSFAKNKNEEGFLMKTTTSNVMKGIGVGMLVGGATALIGGSMKNSKKMNYKKMANKAMKTANNIMDTFM